MSDKEVAQAQNGGSLLDKAKAALNKAARESAEAKVKAEYAKRVEHETAIRQIDEKITQIVADYEAGIV